MAQMSIRNLDDKCYAALKVRAKNNKRSLEAEARAILEEAARVEHIREFITWSDAIRAKQKIPKDWDSTAEIRTARDRIRF